MLKTTIIIKDVFHKIIDDYYKQNYGLNDLLTNSEKSSFQTQMKLFFNDYANKTGEEVVKQMLSFKQTWDNYAVSVIYLYIIKDMNIDTYMKYSKQLKAYVDYLKYILL